MSEQQPQQGVAGQATSAGQMPGEQVPQQPVAQQPVAQQPVPPQVAPQPAGQIVYAWQRQTRLETVRTEPLAYHRLWRGSPKYEWWRPLLGIVLAVVFYLVLGTVFGAVVGAIAVMIAGGSLSTLLFAAVDVEGLLDTQNPIGIALSLGAIVLMIPSVMLAMLCVGVRPVGRIWSVTGRFRLSLYFRGLLYSSLIAVVMFAIDLVPMLLSEGFSGAAFMRPGFSVSAAITSAVIVLLLVPFQALAEEMAFRGLGMQVLGSWMRAPWLSILLTSALFTVSHEYNGYGLVSVFLLGVAACYITWRTGGIEFAAGLHASNNLLVFWLFCSGITGTTAQATNIEGNWFTILTDLVSTGLVVLVAELYVRRARPQRLRVDQVVREVPVDVPTAVPAGAMPSAPAGAAPVAPAPAGTAAPVAPVQPAAPGTPAAYAAPVPPAAPAPQPAPADVAVPAAEEAPVPQSPVPVAPTSAAQAAEGEGQLSGTPQATDAPSVPTQPSTESSPRD